MSKFGKFFFTVIVLALVGWGVSNFLKKSPPPDEPGTAGLGDTPTQQTASKDATAASREALKEFEFLAVPDRVPALPAPNAFQPKDGTLIIELSEYAGYAGLILANGGLEPSEDSFFFKNYGFKVKITLSEEDSWPALQRGDMAATSTTVDVLPCYGRGLQVTVPAQICFSRGADGIIVRKDIRRINDLKGKVVACAPFNETEFFLRYLAQEANLEVQRLGDLSETPDPAKVNLVFCEDAMIAGDAFEADLEAGGSLLAGCVTWAPRTTELVEAHPEQVRQLVDNRNLLVISDILMFNKGFAEAHPEMVKGVVHGLLVGNDQVRNDPAKAAPALAKAFTAFEWTVEDALNELSKVHLSNLPENLAFFSGAIDAAGSFEGIFQSSALAYGGKIIPNPPPAEYFTSLAALEALKADGILAEQQIAIKPIKTATRSPIEADPLLSKDVRFLFEPNSYKLDEAQAVNTEYLGRIQQLLKVSPGSIVLLRGHVDDAKVEDFRKSGGEPLVRNMALKAMELSKNRAEEVKKHLVAKLQIDPVRVEVVGRGWEEPAGPDSDLNRRVEIQWFTVE